MSKTQDLIRRFRHAIEQRQLQPGDRLPSLRRVCRDYGVSMTTAQRAYAELERTGLVRAVPKSGFVVRRPAAGSAQAGVSGLSTGSGGLPPDVPMPWGCPFINPALIDTDRLTRALTQVLQRYQTALHDTSPDGYVPLRKELALHYLGQGVTLEGEELMVTCGAMEALTLALRAVVAAGISRTVIVATPAFPALLEQMRALGLNVVGWAVPPDKAPDTGELERLFDALHPAALVIMANQRHPTGSTLSEAVKRRIVGIAARHRTFIVEDDSYRDLHFGDLTPLPLKAYDGDGLVLHCSTFSKSLAPGFRVGWIAAGRLSELVRGLKLCSSPGASLPGQMTLARLLATGHHHDILHGLRRRLRARCLAMADRLRLHFPPDCRPATPAGGYFLWQPLPDGADGSALLPQAIGYGLHYTPGVLCHPAAEPSGPHALRLNFSFYDPDRQQHGIELLGRLFARGGQPI